MGIIAADSSSMISLAINCMSNVLRDLNAKVVVSEGVYDEIITHPINTKHFALEAMRIRKLFSEGVVSVEKPDSHLTHRILDLSNSVYSFRGYSMKIIHEGEAEALSLAKAMGADALLVDERTTRLLIEDPEELGKVLSSRNQKEVRMDYGKLQALEKIVSGVSVIRSSEIAAVAYENGILEKYLGKEDHKVLEAVLCALKFSGCSISWDEISEYMRAV